MEIRMNLFKECQICGWICKYTSDRLSMHIRHSHPEYSSKSYYDAFLFRKIQDHNTDLVCANPKCTNEVSFEKLTKGYRKYCCGSCGATTSLKRRFKEMDKETYDSWRKKKSDAQKRIWATMPDEERKRRGDNHSKHLTQMILDGEFEALPTYIYIKHGWHKSNMAIGGKVYYRSSWELEAFKFLDLFPNIVDCYYTCPIAIPYEFYGKSKNYIPDIFISYIDGTKELVEIKPSPYLSDEKVQAKIIAGDAWCKDNDLKFSVWTEKTFPF
jgi:hypothetical protein